MARRKRSSKCFLSGNVMGFPAIIVYGLGAWFGYQYFLKPKVMVVGPSTEPTSVTPTPTSSSTIPAVLVPGPTANVPIQNQPAQVVNV